MDKLNEKYAQENGSRVTLIAVREEVEEPLKLSWSLYSARESKGTGNHLDLRSTEADKVRCGKRHFEAPGQDFKVVVTAGEV